MLLFIRAIGSNSGNLSRLSLIGMLFLLNILLIYVIFTAFWIKVNLIDILKVLVVISPFSFLIFYKALKSADCSVSEFRLVERPKKDWVIDNYIIIEPIILEINIDIVKLRLFIFQSLNNWIEHSSSARGFNLYCSFDASFSCQVLLNFTQHAISFN